MADDKLLPINLAQPLAPTTGRVRPFRDTLREIVREAKYGATNPQTGNLSDELAWMLIDHVRACAVGTKELIAGLREIRQILDGKDATDDDISAVRESRVTFTGGKREIQESVTLRKRIDTEDL